MESERPDNKPVSRFPSSTNWLFPFMVNCNGLLAWLALPVAFTEPQNSFTGKEVLDRLSCIFAEFPTKWTSDLIKRICVKSHSFDVDSFLVAFSQKVTRTDLYFIVSHQMWTSPYQYLQEIHLCLFVCVFEDFFDFKILQFEFLRLHDFREVRGFYEFH